MGILDWFESDEEDRSLIEISNDSGDHLVVDIPTEGVKATEKALREAGVEKDNDDRLSNTYGASRIVDSRNPKQHRYRSERVVNESEDLRTPTTRRTIPVMMSTRNSPPRGSRCGNGC